MPNRTFPSRRLRRAVLAALVPLLLAPLAATPVRALPQMSQAEAIRRLDIMFMVTGLRCRTTADDFRADYARFTTRQLPVLNRAAAQLRGELAARGDGGALALDRMSVSMANAYGRGHPWLSCADLKLAVRNLAEVRGEATLAEAAVQLLDPQGAQRPQEPKIAYVFP